ncbi:hypothetical protein WAE58_24330 [Pedobacter panaciterrae]|jgi:hypothetical protein|uniref:Uncharacterized protein n=1 Tax=Pedobacter panaciterrae TaxID=363849 RepID=A0ABU8NTJ6_9SPHI
MSTTTGICSTLVNPASKDFKFFIQPALEQHKIKEIQCIEGTIRYYKERGR